MNFSNFQTCNPTHFTQLEFCCYKSNRLFCQTCWYVQGHPMICNHPKCGHIQKLAHKVISTTLQMKTMQILAQMSPNYQTYDKFHKKFIAFCHIVSRKLKTQIQNKLPVFIWSSMSQMLISKFPKLKGAVSDQPTGIDMLKIIRSHEQNKIKQLEEVMKGIQRINHQYQGLQARLKSKQYSENFQKQIEGISTFFSKQINQLTAGISQYSKKHMELQFGKMLKQFNPSIQFDGVKFLNKKSFDTTQCYNSGSLHSALNQGQSKGNLYRGTIFEIEKLEQTPQLLLQISKSILKQKIFKIYSGINEIKSSYPYKYAYIMCTTLEPDPDYELTILNLQKLNIKNYEKKSQYYFLNSVNIIIMGPELITIQFKNHPKRMAEICIFGAIESRANHYNDILQNQIGISRQKVQKKITKFPFQSKPAPVQLAYIQFQLAYEHLFTVRQNRADFEGQKYALGRGIKLFSDIVKTWKEKATIQLEVQKKYSDLLPLFI